MVIILTILFIFSIFAGLYILYVGAQLCKDIQTTFLGLLYIAIGALSFWSAIINLIKLLV